MSSSPSLLPPAPPVLEIEGVSKRFTVRKDNSLKERVVTLGRAGRRYREDFWALTDVSLSIDAGETVALIGHNGSGKSTLLKVIGGILTPSTGTVLGRGRVAALLELGAGFHPDLTGRENVFLNAAVLGLNQQETADRFDDIVKFSGVGEFIDTQVKFYSSGMYVRLAFAVAVHTDPDVLIVDEVLAVGDEAFQQKCMDKIRSFQAEGRTIILVTHSMQQVAELCDRAVLLDKGRVVIQGEVNDVISAFREGLEERRQTDLQELELGADDPLNSKIVSTTVRGPRGDASITSGETLTIDVTVSHPTGIDDWVCAIQIFSEHGQVVYGTGSDHSSQDPGTLRGERTVTFELPELMLGGGRYYVRPSLQDEARRELANEPRAASFRVYPNKETWGTVFTRPDIRFSAAG